MGECNVLVNEKLHKVELPASTSETVFKANIDGKIIEVELYHGIKPGEPFFIKVEGKPYMIELIKNMGDKSVTVKVDGTVYTARLAYKRNTFAQALTPTITTSQKLLKTSVLEKGAVIASMPGKVVLLRVKPGDSVRAGDVLLVVESMKMENEIVSPFSGVVKEVKVSEGSTVNIGEVMLILEI
ncbi:MAG: biotin/lipoyl-containing protein [Candidatus Bathyarchaeia archaeon]